jgi:hypothetical protein
MTDNVKKPGKQMEAVGYMIHQRLKTFTPAGALADQVNAHLDEDALCAFVEGRIQETESSPVISHLVGCGPCRRITAQLIRFDSQFAPEQGSTAPDEGPGRLRSFLERTAARVTPSFEEEYLGDSVVAYQIPKGEDDEVGQTTSGKTEDENSVAKSKPQIEDGEGDH